jgi:RsiW-degrading membrane proteinase PrsW (M82 family)
MNLLIVALAPVFIILLYIYVRDKYKKEPISLLIKALLIGMLIPIPIVFVGQFFNTIFSSSNQVITAFYDAFVVAAFTEESFKFLGLYLLIWKHKEFDERFDGIVYAVFISLGFAAVENVLYVYEYGQAVGYTRAFTAVPAHAIFGIIMGYYFSLAKFKSKKTELNLFKAVAIPILFHGIYDFILMVENPIVLLTFFPFLIFMWVIGFRKMKILTSKS